MSNKKSNKTSDQNKSLDPKKLLKNIIPQLEPDLKNEVWPFSKDEQN